jgi:phospholipid transport system substrate-binding protein
MRELGAIVMRVVGSCVARIATLLFGAVLLVGAGIPPGVPSATAMVNGFHMALNDAAKKSSGKDFEARQLAFAPVVRANYDTGFMARIAAGPYWDKLTLTERDALAATFTDLTAANYASRIRGALQFTVVDQQPAPQDRMLVHAQLQRKNGESLKMSYLLERIPAAAGWAIIDVWLNDTVSELALRRAEFAPVLRDKGGAALIADLRSKIAALPGEDDHRPSRL